MLKLPATLLCVIGLVQAALAGGPLVLTAPEGLFGRQARLGEGAALGVVVGERDGLTVAVDLPPGRYAIEAVVRSNGRGEALRQRTVSLSAPGASSSATLAALDRGVPLSVSFVNRESSVRLRFELGRLTVAMQNEMHRLVAADEGVPDGGADGLAAPAADPSLEALALELLGDGVLDASERRVPVVLLEELRFTPRSGPVIVRRVASDRTVYAPGGEGELTVELENLSANEQRVELGVAMVEGLATRQVLVTEQLTLPPRGTATKQVGFAVGQALWGRGFEAVAVTAAGSDLGTHAVTVADNPWIVALHGGGVPMFGSELWTAEQAQVEAERLARENLASYTNIYEKFAWAACDYSEMTPEDDGVIHSGQTQYTSKRSAYQILHEVFARHGIAAITYGKSCGGGLAGLEFSHAHPQLMNIFGHAGFAHESLDVDVIDRMLEGRYRIHGRDEDFWQMWISCWTHYGNHETTFYGCDEIARSAKLLGWNGVRYDGAWEVWGDPVGTARLLAAAERRIAEQVPGFVFGYNHGDPRHNERAGALTDVVMAAMARGGGQVMSEYYRGLTGAVEVNILHLQNMGDAVRQHGGYFLCIFDDGTAWNTALVMAAGARPMGGGSHRGLRKFATRFSQYIFDPALRRLENPGAVVRPLADPGFRWDAFVYERAVSENEAQLILHWVNVSNDTVFGDQYTEPANLNPPQRDLVFEIAPPPGYRLAGVFATEDHDTFAPMPARLEDNRLLLPNLRLWNLVVLNFERDASATTTVPAPAAAGQPRPLELVAAPPENAAWQEAAGLRPVTGGEAVGGLDLDWTWHVHRGLQRRDGERAEHRVGETLGQEDIQAINEGRVRITPKVLDAVLALGLPKDTAPGDELYDGVSFEAHRGGRDAGWDDTPAQPLPPVRNGRPDLLHARGPFSHRHRLEEAFAWIDGAAVADSAVRNISSLADLSAKNPGSMRPWPERAGLARHDAVVLDAVPASALSLPQRRDLRDFVAGGGGLFVIGGWYSLSKGQYEGSFVEEALPARTRQAAYLRRVRPADGRLVATAAYARVLGVAAPEFGERAAVEWLGHLEPRAGSQVLVETAGGLPVLVAGSHGAGRALVWAASNSGQPEAPWWESAWWPEVARAGTSFLLVAADTVSPPDAELAARLAKARAMLEEAKLDLLLDEVAEAKTHDPVGVAKALELLLRQGDSQDALAAATYLLDQARHVEPESYPELTELVVGHLAPGPTWAGLAERHLREPPHGLDNLVAEIAAAALPQLTLAAIRNWKLDSMTRLHAIAAIGSPDALPELRQRQAALDAQDEQWREMRARGEMPVDMYRTRLERPFVTWALLHCGQPAPETLHAFARACLELPYYHWRQHWVLANRQAGLVEARRAGGDGAEQRAAVRACEHAIRDLARAMRRLEAWFTPEQIGTTPEARRAVARALAEADSRKALPLALAYVRATPAEHLPDLAALETARLDSLRDLYAARKGR